MKPYYYFLKDYRVVIDGWYNSISDISGDFISIEYMGAVKIGEVPRYSEACIRVMRVGTKEEMHLYKLLDPDWSRFASFITVGVVGSMCSIKDIERFYEIDAGK